MWVPRQRRAGAVRLPEIVRKWGLAKYEFVESGNWPHQLYIREARRMVSRCSDDRAPLPWSYQGRRCRRVGRLQHDLHHCRRLVIDGKAVNEGDVQFLFRRIPSPTAPSVPREEEVANLIVPVCLSSSHISYGSIRMSNT